MTSSACQASNSKKCYCKSVLKDQRTDPDDAVYYCGGLVDTIDLFNHDSRQFDRYRCLCRL